MTHIKQIKLSMESFAAVYANSHQGRKLTWLHTLSNGIVQTNYELPGNKFYQLHVSTYQLAILLCFNENEKMSVQQLMSETNLPPEEIYPPLLVPVKNNEF
jgi:cullin 1